MSTAYSLFNEDPVSPPSLSLFAPPGSAEWVESASNSPDFSGSKTRITNPGVRQSSTLDVLERLRDQEKDDLPEVTDEQREHFRSAASLAEFYWTVLDPWRHRQKAKGGVQSGTLTNERQSVRCYEEFDRATRPDGWPLGVPWIGRPAPFVGAQYVEDWLAYRLQFGTKKGPLSPLSIPKRWYHLRFVINWAFRLGIMDKQISVSVDEIIQKHCDQGDELLDELDAIPVSYTDAQLHAIYQQLDGDLELQTAWVLGAQVGPRPSDLFSLRWQKNVRLQAAPADVTFIAIKTNRKKKRIWVPLGPIAIGHLNRLARLQAHLAEPHGLVFPRLTDGHRKDPEDGDRSRARTCRIKRAIAGAGIPLIPEMDRPWQMLRATCNSRLNGIESPMGDRATHGPAGTVQGQSYTDYREPLSRAVQKLDAQWAAAGIFARK